MVPQVFIAYAQNQYPVDGVNPVILIYWLPKVGSITRLLSANVGGLFTSLYTIPRSINAGAEFRYDCTLIAVSEFGPGNVIDRKTGSAHVGVMVGVGVMDGVCVADIDKLGVIDIDKLGVADIDKLGVGDGVGDGQRPLL